MHFLTNQSARRGPIYITNRELYMKYSVQLKILSSGIWSWTREEEFHISVQPFIILFIA